VQAAHVASSVHTTSSNNNNNIIFNILSMQFVSSIMSCLVRYSGPGLASTRSPFWVLLQLRMMKVG